MQTYSLGKLKIKTVSESADRVCYILYPFEGLGEWIEEAAQKYDLTIVGVTGMDWDDDLTPWPAQGQPPGSPDFRGRGPAFLKTLTTQVLPQVEQKLGISAGAERTLVGVSLSGLFTLWQWMIDDTFHNIISLSGSFWYEGFAEWIKTHPVPKKTGRAYFLLGNQEARTNVKAFQPVQTDTVEIVNYLHNNGINDHFDLVPGNHYQYGLQRLNRSFVWMFGAKSGSNN